MKLSSEVASGAGAAISFHDRGGGGGTKCEERGRSDVMSQNVFFGGGEKKIRIIIALTCSTCRPRGTVFQSWRGGGDKVFAIR